MEERETYAPVALFVYNRLDNTRRTVEALRANLYADKTVLYVFSDGGRDERSWSEVNEVREYLGTVTGFAEVNIVERPVNFYLEPNVMQGIAEVLGKHDRIIVLEDDIVTGPYFLDFMNSSLDVYREDKRVMHVTGFNYFDMDEPRDFVFTRFMSCWGWATWADRWESFNYYGSPQEALGGLTDSDKDVIQYGGNFQSLKTLEYKVIPWDICWVLSIYKQKGVCIMPVESLVRNVGIYSGTHARSQKIFGRFAFDREPSQRRLKVEYAEPQINEKVETQLEEFFRKGLFRYNLFGRIARFVYLRIKGGKK